MKSNTKSPLLGPKQLKSLLDALVAHYPDPQTELVYASPFELLVSVLLSAQATDISVNKATKILFPIANTPQKILDLGLEQLMFYLKSIGLYRNKSKHLIATCELLLKNYNGEVPETREGLESLPGVGRKTANVLLNTLYGKATIAVDTHVFRVANRTGLAQAATPLAVELQLLKRIPSAYIQKAHHSLVLHGRYICTARRPKCSSCPLFKHCAWPEKLD